MPAPTGRDLYVDQILSNILIGYRNPAFIAGLIGRRLPVSKDTGIIPKLLQSQWFRDLAQPKKPGSKATEGGFGTDLTATYYLPQFAHAVRVLDSDRDNAAGGPFQMDKLASMMAGNVVDLKMEIVLAALFFAASKGWTDKVVSTDFTAWDDLASANPMLDISKFQDEVSGKIGVEPMSLIVGQEAFTRGLKWNPALIDVVRFTSKGVLSADQIAEILGIVLKIGKAIYTTSVEGTAEASVAYTRVWGKKALLLNEPTETDMSAPGLVRVVREQNGGERWVRRFRYEEEQYDKFEANRKFQFKQIDGRAGIFMDNVVS